MSGHLEHLILQRRGVLRRSELLAAGMTRRHMEAAVRAGTWQASGRSVLIHESAQPGLQTDTLVAAARNPDAPLTGVSAALLRPHPVWTGRRFPDARAMLIAPGRRRGPWLAIQHPGAGHTVIHGIKVADAHTTLIDLMRFLPWRDAAAVAGAANQQALTPHDRLVASVADLRGYAGAQQLRRLVSAMLDGAESGPEIDLHYALRRERFRAWVANPIVVIGTETFRPDVAFPATRVAVEYDGVEEHSSITAFHDDRERDFAFEFWDDWLVARMTSRILYRPAALAKFLRGLRVVLAKRRRRGTNRARTALGGGTLTAITAAGGRP